MMIDIGPVNRKNKETIIKASEFYASKLISPRIVKNLSLEILHDSELEIDDLGRFL